ncbi:hypothetical protein OTB20_41620 [Streptomyces sp. H27-H1]|uniref:hypothetical protein n=1 Tax=Streptomyces sp. H27-H1 TaxID=2996461 RepID=UPI00226E1AD5|nr:hypothetical protein [Streptomyces sp. H27-H1]MCY0932518.1 hypothetical protein [Streptomyces sp. H27-H1]
MKYKFFRPNALLGISLAISGSLLVLPNVAGAEKAQAPSQGGAFATVAAEKAAMAGQAPISEAANEVYRAAQQDPKTGYAGLVISAEDHGYTLSWNGAVPQGVSSLIEAHRAKGMQVSVRASRYTFRELDERARAIVDSGAKIGGAPVTAAGASSDGDSLNIGVDVSALPVGNHLPNDRASVDSISKYLAGGIPVNINEEAPKESIADRNSYHGNWMGGQVLRINGAVCTSGFSAISPTQRRTYLITAQHCGKKGDTVTDGSGNATVGKVVDTSEEFDSLLIEIEPWHQAMEYIQTGYGIGLPVTSGMEKVAADGRAFVGERLCASGALMGEVCGAKVVSVSQWVKMDSGSTRHVDTLEQIAGRFIAGSGDSGGPVFAYSVSGGVSARGILSATKQPTKCKNPLPGGKKTRTGCSERVYITNIYEQLWQHSKSVGNLGTLRVQAFDK